MSADKKFVLIDSNAIMHRAFHALPPLTTKSGEVVSVPYGFSSILLRVVKDLKPDYIACAFDVAGGTFRDEIFDKYKATRKKPDQEFYDQIEKVKDVVRAMNIPIYEMQGFEADDVIGTIVTRIDEEKEGIETFIVTGDMDAFQLIDTRVKVYTLKKGISETAIYDAEKVRERYGFGPEQVIDYKALRGDASDNIPGVKGVGEKTATIILQEFGSLDKLYARIEKGDTGSLRPKVVEKLLAEKEAAFMSRELATIKCDVEVGFGLKDCLWGDYDREKLTEVFRRFEFFSLIGRLNDVEKDNGNKNFAVPLAPMSAEKRKVEKIEKVACRIVEEEKDILLLADKLEKNHRFVFDTVESEHKIAELNLTALTFVFDKSEIFYVPVAHTPEKTPTLFGGETIVKNDFLQKLKPYLENSEYKKIGFDLKRSAEALAAYDITLGGLEFDAMLAAYLLDPGKRDYGMEKILFETLGVDGGCEMVSDAEAKNAPEPELWQWAYLFDLAAELERAIKDTDMERLFAKIEMPLISVLRDIEMAGVKIDTKLLRDIAVETDKEIKRLSATIHEMSGDNDFNINSSRQLADVLFEKMKISTAGIKKGKTGYSVAASELDKMRGECPIVDFISEYRELSKLKNTYIDTLPRLINSRTKRLHTTFNQNVTATGRLSSSDPNLQNIPVRTDIGRRIREAFVAEEGRTLLSADYSQIELRIIATIADDKKMQEIFNKGLDIHTATAADVNGVPIEEVTPQMRRAAKALNFGVIYGMSVFGFAASAGIDRTSAKKFIDDYMENFTAIAAYIERSKLEAAEKGYAETLWGRRRYLPELHSHNAMVRAGAERMAINMPVQGTAADLMKINMIKIHEWAEKYNKDNPGAVWTLLQVHDELLFSIKKEFLSDAEKFIKHEMENGHIKFDGRDIDFSVPIEVSLKAGKNWGEMR
ncbi:MAG: DNA polymerase I [Candidatus Pacebacteria bacterium]|nr:DNA polymerase I [Candidatus Paceibacterota bacterium]